MNGCLFTVHIIIQYLLIFVTYGQVPVNIENTLQVNVISSHKTVDKAPGKFTVTIVREFFEESTNGRILATGLIACAKSCDFSKRKKRDITNLEYTVGSDDCGDTSPDEYCNGPLLPGRTYKFAAAACTNGGCLFSTFQAPESTEKNCTTQSLIIGVVLGLTNLILLLYAGYTTLVIRRYRANEDDSVMHKARKSDSRGPMYVNESFMEGVAEAAEGPINPALNRDSETELYSRLDENTRDDKATYDIIQAM